MMNFQFLDTHNREIVPGIFPKYSIAKPVDRSAALNGLRMVFEYALSIANQRRIIKPAFS